MLQQLFLLQTVPRHRLRSDAPLTPESLAGCPNRNVPDYFTIAPRYRSEILVSELGSATPPAIPPDLAPFPLKDVHDLPEAAPAAATDFDRRLGGLDRHGTVRRLFVRLDAVHSSGAE